MWTKTETKILGRCKCSTGSDFVSQKQIAGINRVKRLQPQSQRSILNGWSPRVQSDSAKDRIPVVEGENGGINRIPVELLVDDDLSERSLEWEKHADHDGRGQND